ncbi:MAG: hypothetical protein H6566_05640 [Lewinellaceae bacterium]|nr:hypothetical protein [Lewinellaceae bacterium]
MVKTAFGAGEGDVYLALSLVGVSVEAVEHQENMVKLSVLLLVYRRNKYRIALLPIEVLNLRLSHE